MGNNQQISMKVGCIKCGLICNLFYHGNIKHCTYFLRLVWSHVLMVSGCRSPIDTSFPPVSLSNEQFL